MTATVTRAAPDVWVATGSRELWCAGPAHAEDLAAAEPLPHPRRAEYLAGRALLRHLLRLTVPEHADAWVRADGHGRPFLDGAPDTGISISHDGDTVAAAVGRRRRVGVDVQLPAQSVPDSLLRRCLGPYAEGVRALPEGQRALELAWVWTVQEACVKAAGTGLSGSPWTIDVPPGHRRGTWGAYRWISLRDHSRTPLSCAYTRLDDARETPCF
ncbi:4'-phosphopantetheinyl transferase family protein [Streptomyces cyaneofuscatus]|uniref:4'-phosphopantetheinyl transferase family protein n=1 Tax=Streptomyces cyaneofuscatus TaxID=66883 RepID=UPI003447C3DE